MPVGKPDRKSSRRADLATEVRVSVLRLSRRLRTEQAVAELVSEAQFCVLADLKNAGPLTPTELADREQVQPPSMTRTIAGLADAGLVARERSDTDRRNIVVSLTARGESVVEETRRRRTAWLARKLAQLTPQERDAMRTAATIMRSIVEE